MQQINQQPHKNQTGFALLLTLITVTALISIGLSVLDLSIKQVRLSTIATDSEIAFSAANAGVECALYWRREPGSATAQETDVSFSPSCFEATSVPENVWSNAQLSLTPVPAFDSVDGDAYIYDYQFTWGSPARCSKIRMLVMSADVGGNGVEVTNMTELFDRYPNGNDKTCQEGVKCTIIAAEGFNKACSSVTGHGTVQREVLIQL